MTESTTPDGIVKWTVDDAASLVSMSTAMGNSIQTALNKRERYDFVWEIASERTAQTGMVQGSRGYQIDTESEYIYDTGVWVLARAHTAYTFSKSITSGGVPQDVGTLTYKASESTSSTIVTTSTSPDGGQVIFKNPGIYAYSAEIHSSGVIPMTGRSFIEASFSEVTTDNASIIARVNIAVNEDRGFISIPNLRITEISQPVFLRYFHSNGAAVTMVGQINITRLG
jgi:hypothetical protein